MKHLFTLSERSKDKWVGMVNFVMQFLKLTKLTKLTEQIFAESLKSLKSLMSIFAGNESYESTEGYRVKSRITTTYLRLASVFALVFVLGVGNVLGAETTYTFSSKSWAASPANWTSGKDGNSFTANQGIQVTTGVTGANGTSPSSFTSITKIVVQYCTNASKGAGTIEVKIGNNTEKTFSVTKPSSGGTTLKNAIFTYSTPESGKVKVTAECTTNSVYIYSVTIYYQTAITLNANGGSANKSATYNYEGTSASSFTAVTRSGYNCTGYYTASSAGTKILNADGSLAAANITVSSKPYVSSSKWVYSEAELTLYAQWESAGCTNNVNISKGPESHGTFTLSKTGSQATCNGLSVIVTPSAATHYHVGSVSATSGETGVDNGDGTWTITYAANATGSSIINVVFAEDNKYTLNYHDGSGDNTKKNVYEGTNLITALGAPAASCDATSTTFVGWVTSEIATKTDIAPTFVSADAVVNSTTAVATYYAVYAKAGVETSVCGGSIASNFGETGLSGSHSEFYSGNGFKFKAENNYVQTSNLSSNNYKQATVKLKAGHNGGAGSVLTIASFDGSDNVIDSKTLTPSEAYGSQNTTYSFNLTGSTVIKYIRVTMTSKTNNLGMKYCEVFYTPMSEYMTTCCTPLSPITGAVSLSQLAEGVNAGKLQATWPAQSNTDGWAANGIQIKIYEEGNATPVVISEALANSTTSFTANDFTPKTCTNYYATLTALHGGNASYCAGNLVSDPSENVTTAGYTYINNSTNVNLVAALPASTCANGGADVNIQFTAAAGYRLPSTDEEIDANVSVTNAGEKDEDWSCGFANDVLTITVNPTKATGNIGIKVDGIETVDPEISVSKTEIDFSEVKKGVATSTTFTVEGANLSNNITLSSDEEAFTLDTYSLTQEDGSVALTTITLTANTSTAGEYMGTITISDGNDGATDKTIDVYLTVLETYTVNWYVNGSLEHTQTDVANTAYDEVPSDFSAFTDCSEFTFVGWSETAFGSTTPAPSLANIGSAISAANKNYYAVFAEGTPGGTNELLNETFASCAGTGGNDNTWSGNIGTSTINTDVSGWKTANAGGASSCIKAGTGSKAGSATTPSISITGNGKLNFRAGAFGSDNTTINLTATGATLGTTSVSPAASQWSSYEVDITEATGSVQITFTASAASNQRFFLDDVLVTQTVAPIWTKYYTTCPHVTRVRLNAPEVSNGSISFAQDSKAVTNVRTDDGNAVVDVVASPAIGYELTGVALSGVAGASYDAGVITIPQDAEGTLTVTATFAQKNYSIAVETYPAEIGADLTGATSTAKYGVEQTISTNEPTGYLFGGWYMYDAEDTEKETDLSSELFTGIYESGDLELSASFLMPDKNLVAEAYFDKIYTPAEALALDDLTDSVYVEGVISQVDEVSTQYKNATYWISADGTTTNQIKIYRGKHINKADVTVDNAAQIAVGNKVRVRGKLSQSSNVNQFGQGTSYITVLVEKTLSALTIVGDASVTTYDVGDSFDKTGLSLSATYNTGYVQANYTGTTITSDYDAPTTFTAGVAKVTVSAVEGLISTSRDIPVTVSSAVLDRVEISAAAQTEFWAKEQYKEPLLDAYLTDEPATILHNVTGESNTTGLNMSEPGNKSVSVTYTRKAGQSDDVEYNFTVKPVVVDEAHAHSVATARAIIDVDNAEGEDLELADESAKTHVVGVVKSVTALTGSNTGKYTIVLEDQTDNTKTIELFRSTYGTGITSVEVGDVIKAYGNLYWYAGGSKYEINEGGQVVWKQPKVSITIANKTLEVGDVWTIAATIDPAAAPVTYSIKDGSDDCVTLATNVITATAEGTATIIASAEAYDDGVNTYAANSKEFTITVNPAAVHTNVVLLAEYNGTYYALKNDASTVTVEMNGGMVVVANETTKNAIIWDRAEREGVATFKNGDNYLNANGSNDMTVSDTEVSWNWNSTYYRKGTDVRTFLYQAGGVNKIKYYAVSNAGNANYSNLPIIYTGKVAIKIAPTGDDPITKDEDDVPSNASIVVSNKVTLEINNAKTLDNLTVEAGGTVSGSAALSVNDLTIKTNSGAFAVTGTSGQLTGSVMPVVSGDLFIEIKLCEGAMDAEASRKWYCISAPFNVNMNGGFFWGDGTQMVLNTDFQLFEWDGDRRATGISGWKRVSGVMKAGIAYFIGFDDERSNQNTIKLKAMSNTISNADKIVAPTHTGSAEAATYGNWNGLANPNFHHIALSKNVQAFNYDKQAYSPYAAGAYNFVVGTPFFIQYAGDIAISAANGSNPYRAPKREGELYSYCVRIGSANKTVADNQIYVRASETASAEYDSEREMITLNGTTSNYGALLWTVNYGGKRLAIEEAPLVNDKASYALSLYAPADGAYRIETPTVREDASLYLTYEGNIIWDLSAGAYELDLNKGATEGYGLMLVRKAPQVTTGVENVQGDKTQCTKVILNDHVYILRDAQLYDVTGKAVK